jgi:hypothetical protein
MLAPNSTVSQTELEYAKMVSKPVVVISIGYCVLSSVCFQLSADGSLQMSGARQVGLVSGQYALDHATDAVLFKQVGPKMFEFRVKHPILGYAGVPWLSAHRTNIDLLSHCQKRANDGCTLRND